MAGPGGKEVGRVNIRVLPNTSAFRSSLEKYVQRVERSMRIEIPTVIDGDGLVADARRVARTAEKSASVKLPTEVAERGLNTRVSALAKRLSGKDITFDVDLDRRSVGSTIIRVAKLASSLRTLALPAAILGAAPSIAAIGIAAAQAAGSVALLPAALTSVVAGFAAARMAFTGFGEAMSSMDDPAKFAEALSKLAPAARDAAIGIREIRPAFGQLRLDVQQALFERMGRTISDVATAYLPTLRDGLTKTAAALGDMAKQSGQALMRPDVINAVRVQLDQTSQAFRNMAPALGNVVAGLMHIGEAGSKFLPGLATGASNAAAKFATWAKSAKESGRLAEIIEASFVAIQKLGSVLGNIGSIIAGVFRAANIEGAGFLNILDSGTEKLANWINSAQGFSSLRQVFSGVQAAVGGILTGLGSVLAAFSTHLGPVIAELGPAIGQLARQLGATLAAAIKVAAPLLLVLATFLRENMTWLGPLAIAVGTASVAFLGLYKAAKAVDSLITAVTFLKNSKLVGWLGTAAAAVGRFVVRVVVGTATVVARFIWMTVTTIARVALMTAQVAIRFTIMAAQVIARTVVMAATVVARFTVMAAQVVARVVMLTVQVAVRFAVMAAQAVARTVVMAASVATQFAIMSARAVASMAVMAAQVVARWAMMAAGAMARAAVMAAAWFVAMGPIGWVIGAVVALVALVIANWDRVKAWTISAWNATANFVKNAWNRITSAVSSGVSNVVGWVRSLPGRILGAIGNLGSLLWNAGVNLIRGLINGAKSMIGGLLGTVRNMASQAASAVRGALGIGSPSKVFAQIGEWTSEGLARGIEQAAPHAVGAAADMAHAVAATPAPSLDASSSRSGSHAESLQAAVTAGVLSALHEARLRVDGDGVAQLVNKTNAANARR